MKMLIGNGKAGLHLQFSPSLHACTELVLAKLLGRVLSLQGTWALSFLITNIPCFQASSQEDILVITSRAVCNCECFPFPYCNTEAGRYKKQNITNSPVAQKVIFIPVGACRYLPFICHYSCGRAVERHNKGKDHFCFQFAQHRGTWPMCLS